MPNRARQKGDRKERLVVKVLNDNGIKAERVPLSGSTGYQGNVGDVDVYAFGEDQEPIQTEVKSRKNGTGFTVIDKWMGDHDLLIVAKDRKAPMVVLTWDLWMDMLKITTSANKGRKS